MAFTLPTIHPDGQFLIDPDDPDPWLASIAFMLDTAHGAAMREASFVPTAFVPGKGSIGLAPSLPSNLSPIDFPIEAPLGVRALVDLPAIGIFVAEASLKAQSNKEREIAVIAKSIADADQDMVDTQFGRYKRKPVAVGTGDDGKKRRRRAWIYVRTYAQRRNKK